MYNLKENSSLSGAVIAAIIISIIVVFILIGIIIIIFRKKLFKFRNSHQIHITQQNLSKI